MYASFLVLRIFVNCPLRLSKMHIVPTRNSRFREVFHKTLLLSNDDRLTDDNIRDLPHGDGHVVGRRGVVGRGRGLPLPVGLHACEHPGHARHPGAGAPDPALQAGVDDVDCVGGRGGVPIQALTTTTTTINNVEKYVIKKFPLVPKLRKGGGLPPPPPPIYVNFIYTGL